MKDTERRAAAKAFAEYWKDRGDEKSDSQSFWLSLARDVLGVAEPEKFILFEERVSWTTQALLTVTFLLRTC